MTDNFIYWHESANKIICAIMASTSTSTSSLSRSNVVVDICKKVGEVVQEVIKKYTGIELAGATVGSCIAGISLTAIGILIT
jgi:hypothetical protein